MGFWRMTKKTNRKFRFISILNVRSLIKHIDELRLFEIISVNETMLNLSVSNQEIKINGYDIVRKDRNRHGGGVAIYIRTSINFIIRDDLTDDNLETITLEISKPKAKPFLINSWYKPPNTTLEIFKAFEDLITRMHSENKEIILLGDYNCDWSRLDSNSANAQTNKLAGIAQTFQFQQLISEPTRITANSKPLIDQAFTNKPELINGSGVIHLHTFRAFFR